MSEEEIVPVLATEPNVSPINIEDEMRTSYIDYSMSVIVGRAYRMRATA